MLDHRDYHRIHLFEERLLDGYDCLDGCSGCPAEFDEYTCLIADTENMMQVLKILKLKTEEQNVDSSQ